MKRAFEKTQESLKNSHVSSHLDPVVSRRLAAESQDATCKFTGEHFMSMVKNRREYLLKVPAHLLTTVLQCHGGSGLYDIIYVLDPVGLDQLSTVSEGPYCCQGMLATTSAQNMTPIWW